MGRERFFAEAVVNGKVVLVRVVRGMQPNRTLDLKQTFGGAAPRGVITASPLSGLLRQP
jgi:hypothetical protein